METMQANFNSTFRDYLSVLFRRMAVIVMLVVVTTLTAAVGLMLQTPMFEAQVKMLISAKKQVEATYYQELVGYTNEKMTVTQSEIVKSNPILQRTVDALTLYAKPLDYEKKYASPLKKLLIDWRIRTSNLQEVKPGERPAIRFRLALEELKRNVQVEPIRDTNTFIIRARDFSPVGAARIANAISRSYVIFDLEQQLAEIQLKYGGKHPSVIQLRDSINKIIKTMGGSPVADIEAIGPASVKIIEQASLPIHPIGAPKKLMVLIAFMMSLGLGVILAFTFEYLDPTLKTTQETEKALNLPMLGSLPQNGKSRERFAENLADHFYLLMKDKGLKSVLMARVEEKQHNNSRIIADLGRHLSGKAGHPVLLLDADLRRPSLAHYFKIKETPGLAEVLEGKAPFEQAIQVVSGSLAVMTAGKAIQNPINLLDSEKMSQLIEQAKKKFDYIFLTTAGLLEHKDAVLISSKVDGTVVIVDEGRTRKEVAKVAIGPLEDKKSNLIGTIQNNRTFPIPRAIYERV